jgi:putative serine protease PepD
MMLASVVAAAVIGGGAGAGTAAALTGGTSASGPGISITSATAANTPKLNGTISATAAKIKPSVVTINVTGQQLADTGSGVIIRGDGYILTNDHVIAAAAGGGTISVLTADGRTASATVVGRDTADDLAVIKINLPRLTPATFARSSDLVVGQAVVAVGAPLGLSQTVTSGIVSSTGRPVRAGNNSQAVFAAVQTDAAINPGNSGGPLVNLNGDVVGINAAIATANSAGLQVPGQQAGNIGIGFAIPSNEAGRIAAELIASGHATHAVMGVQVRGATSPQSTASAGAVIAAVTGGGAAAGAGLRAGDQVTAVDGRRITGPDALIAAIRSHAPGQTVHITYSRGGSSHTVTLTLGSSPT